MRRQLRLAALTALLVGAAACSSAPTSPGFANAQAGTLTGYVLATGTTSVTVKASSKGTVTLGSSLEATLPDAVKSVLKLTGTALGFSEQYNATADMVVAAPSGGSQAVTFTYKSLSGSISLPIPGQSKEVALSDLSGGAATLSVKYKLNADGTVVTDGKDPVAETFVFAGTPLDGFPSLPKGGAQANSTWSTQKALPDPFSFIKSPITWNGSYTTSDKDKTATVSAETAPIGAVQVSTKDLIATINQVFNLKIDPIDVTASITPIGKITQKTTLSVPDQQLRQNAPTIDLQGQIAVSGASLPQGLKPGPLGTIQVQSQVTTAAAAK